MKSKDWVALIEAGYNLEGTSESWLESVLEHAAPLFTRGFWPTIGTYNYSPMDIQLKCTRTHGPSIARKFLELSTQINTNAVNRFFREGTPVCSLSEAIYSYEPDVSTAIQKITNGLVHDKFAVKALTGQGSALIMCWLFSNTITPTAQERKRWPLMAIHLGAGLRLRAVAESLTLNAESVEAIFDSSGKLYEAREEAKRSSARDILRKAVRRIDKVRTKAGRRNPDSAMKAWEGLVQGRWSLVDYFDSDQRRFVVAIKNDPMSRDPRGLTVRERQVAEFIGLGQSNKEISYTLGLSLSAITNCTARVQCKLGLTSIAELAAFFAPSGLRAKLAEVAVQGETLLIGAYPLINEDRVKGLTDAEREVLVHLMVGSTNRDIAQRRQTSEYTVANQVKAIFRKLEVFSRSELAARLQSVP